MQTQTTTPEPYKYHPALRKITDDNIHKYGEWAWVIHVMVMSARRSLARWEQAAFDATRAAQPDVKHPSLGGGETEAAVRTRAVLRRFRADVKRLEMMLALEVAGRDMAHLDDEIVKCIDNNGANMKATIIRRLFKAGSCDIDYDWARAIERRLLRMQAAGRLDVVGRRTKWYVVTPQVLAEREAAKERRAKQAASEKVREAREAAVIEMMEAKGVKAKAEYGRVEMKLADIEKLLGL